MSALLGLAVLLATISSGHAYTWRDSPSARFGDSVRANAESMRSRMSDPTNRIEIHNERLRERLNATGSGDRTRPRSGRVP